MSAAAVGGSSALEGAPFSRRLRLLIAVAMGAVTLIASTGFVADHLFAQPTTLKYLVTVLAPALLIVVCLSEEPLLLALAGAIVAAPWDLNVTLSGIKLAPVTVLLALATFIAVLEPRSRSRASGTASVVVVALVLLLPAFAIGREQPHYMTWIASTLVAGWLAFHVAQRPGGLRFILSLVVLAATFQGLVAFYEYARHSNLNLYAAEINQAVSRSYFFNFGADFRPSGTLPDPDSLGNMLALACPLALALAASAPARLIKLAWAACAVVIAVALTLSFSRASWIGAGAGVVLAVIVLPPRLRVPALGGVAALAVMTVAIGLAVGGTQLRERVASIEEPTARVNRTARGDEERQHIWSAALTTASANPVVGVGLGRLQEHLSEHLRASPEGLHAQSVYFQFLAESGVVGLLALLLLVGHALTGVLRGLRHERILMAGVAGALLAMLIPWSTDTNARYTSMSVTIAFLVGCAMAQHGRVSTTRLASADPPALA